LFEQVNIESGKQKRLDIIYNSLIDVQRCNEDNQNLVEYVQKEIREIKKNKEKKNLIAQVGDVVSSARANNTRSVGIKKNAEGSSEKFLRELDARLTLQREYYELLRKMQDEYDRS
jgi:hypothetical protein